MNKLNIAKVQS